MSGAVIDFDQWADIARPVAGDAPPLPIERHIVAAALAAERVKQLAQQMLLICQYAPRDAVSFERASRDMLDAWSDADQQYGAYRAVLECKGQA